MHTLVASLTKGALAGAAGTTALNLVTYGDMLLRARPASDVPADVAGRLADRAHLDLGDERQAPPRREAAGALLGLVAGLGVGKGYGCAVALTGRRPPVPVAGALLGLAAMAASDAPATALRVTDPRTWPPSSWASDLVPHLAYGLVTAATFHALTRPRER